MNPIDFILQVIGKHLTLGQDDYITTQAALKEHYDNSDNWIKRFFTKYPFIVLILPFLIPIMQRAFTALMAKIAPDQDGDGDNDMEDLILTLSEKIMSKRARQ